jgi:hypothetical protein
MSDTPETDFVRKSNDCDAAGFCKMMTHARQLERERDLARDMVEQLTGQGLDLMDANRTLKRERDEAREIIRKASAKFCEDGPDGVIAAEIFSILGSKLKEGAA